MIHHLTIFIPQWVMNFILLGVLLAGVFVAFSLYWIFKSSEEQDFKDWLEGKSHFE